MRARMVRIEMAKLRTIGLPWALLAASSALTFVVALVKANQAGKHSGRLTVAPLNTAHGLAQVVSTPDYAIIFALVFGLIVVTGEFRHSTITSTYLAFPNRVRVLVAKLIASGTVGALFGLAATIITTAIGLGFVAAHHYGVALGVGTLLRYAAGDVLACALFAALGVAVGFLIRNQLLTIIVSFAWSLLIEGVLYGLSSSLASYLPYSAARQLAGATLSSVTPLPFAAGIALIAAITAALAAIATRTTLLKDIS